MAINALALHRKDLRIPEPKGQQEDQDIPMSELREVEESKKGMDLGTIKADAL
jgi:hypothetical protein